ncbi:MAG: multiple sugar transport system ATP-binding protein [Paraglaciecola sp.]|jgi:multiple sugar transport system ATP-binding protein
MSAISLKNINVELGSGDEVFRLRDLSLEIEQGEFIVLVGPSGVGKSTILRVLAGLEPIQSGEIWMNGQRVDNKPAANREVAMVFQHHALYPHMSVAQNIGFSQTLKGISQRDARLKVESVAQQLNIAHLLDSKPSALSGGQKQRVALGRAMLCQPQVFLFDEPLSNLDPMLRHHLRGELKQLHQRLNTTSIFVTHDQVEAIALADRIILFSERGIEQIGTPEALFNRPNNQYVAEFFAYPSINIFRAKLNPDGILLADHYLLPCAVPLQLQDPRINVGIRARKLTVDEKHGIPCRVEYTEYLGDEMLVYLRVKGDDDLKVLSTAQANYQDGQALMLSASFDDMLFFSQDGKAIELANAAQSDPILAS